MPMPSYSVYCSTKGCKHLALYKIAARWSDGIESELKTYGLCCQDCLPRWFQQCREKHRQCRLTEKETLDAPGVYQLQRGQRDLSLSRLPELEQQLLQSEPSKT